jgi:hypothetical protein
MILRAKPRMKLESSGVG